jgi:hypothetical protein
MRGSPGALCAPEDLPGILQETNALVLLKPVMLLRVSPSPRANPSKWGTQGGCRFGRSAKV